MMDLATGRRIWRQAVSGAVVACSLGCAAASFALTTHHHAAKAKPVAAKRHTAKAAPAASTRHAAHGSVRAAGHAAARAPHSPAPAPAEYRTIKGRNGRVVRVKMVAHARTRGERFYASSFADTNSIVAGDVTAGEDPTVRAAALDALGNMNGTALVIDPSNGRILTMVNQRLALSSGAEPCSTIKLTVALAALQEGLIKRDTPVSLGGGYKVDLTYALAKSVNPYFEVLGRALGFERVKHYANQLGLGELAGYNIPGEHLGIYPDQELPAKLGGVGRMCSFGEGVSMTPLQLGAIVSAIANGGTLYYLQHPRTPEDVASFSPKVKRTLDIGPLIPEMLPGMADAVEARWGTARSLRANFTEFPVMGKTGTCSNNGTRFGWFGSYADTPNGRLVTVFFLEGGKPTFGPKAAELTGQFYRSLYDRNYFNAKAEAVTSTAGN
jgi:beta-lactamase class D